MTVEEGTVLWKLKVALEEVEDILSKTDFIDVNNSDAMMALSNYLTASNDLWEYLPDEFKIDADDRKAIKDFYF